MPLTKYKWKNTHIDVFGIYITKGWKMVDEMVSPKKFHKCNK